MFSRANFVLSAAFLYTYKHTEARKIIPSQLSFQERLRVTFVTYIQTLRALELFLGVCLGSVFSKKVKVLFDYTSTNTGGVRIIPVISVSGSAQRSRTRHRLALYKFTGRDRKFLRLAFYAGTNDDRLRILPNNDAWNGNDMIP